MVISYRSDEAELPEIDRWMRGRSGAKLGSMESRNVAPVNLFDPAWYVADASAILVHLCDRTLMHGKCIK